VTEALRIVRLAARHWRNLAAIDWEPGPRFNVISGQNGQGKSNLLESIDYLATLRSFRGARTEDLIGDGAPAAHVAARVLGEQASHTYRVQLGRQRPRAVQLDGKRPRSREAYHGALQVVLFHPGDMQLVSGGPDLRRAYMDRILEQAEPHYAAALASYTKALRQRNRLLRDERPDRRAVMAFDPLLARAGASLVRARARLIEELAPRVEVAFAEVIGPELPFEVRYAPRVDPDEQAIERTLAAAYTKDVARGFTADGPHADDLSLRVRHHIARHHASQGQHRALVLALKVAELHQLEQRVGRVPILLLDDVSSELDRDRNRRLFQVLARLGGQVFLTTTHAEFILLEASRCDYRVVGGHLEPA
jgi:DNA replication and repair protein RecF